MLLNAAKFQGYSFYRFWVIKGKQTKGRVILTTPTEIRVKSLWNRKEGRRNKNFKKRVKLGQKVRALEKGGGLELLTNYGGLSKKERVVFLRGDGMR